MRGETSSVLLKNPSSVGYLNNQVNMVRPSNINDLEAINESHQSINVADL